MERKEPPEVGQIESWIQDLEKESGIFLVRFLGDDEGYVQSVNHVILVDASRKLVVDSQGGVTWKLCAEVLRGCLGTDVVLSKVEEVRKVAVKEVGNRRKRKKSREHQQKRKAKRAKKERECKK